jgi:hypothetical protein
MAQKDANSQVDALLQRFPGPIALQGQRPNDGRVFLACLLSLVMGATGGYNIARGDHTIIGLCLIAISGVLILLSLASVIWPPGAFVLSSRGFQQRIFFFWLRFSWRDVGSDFVVKPVINPYGRLVSWIVYFHAERRVWWLGKDFNAGMGAVADLSIEELADLFSLWRNKALSDAAIHQ